MKWQMPPLNWLRPFEATARLGTTVQAADELGRTHGAVSRQIKTLEQWLGHRLFRHDAGRLELTAKGAEYFGTIAHAFDLIDRATRKFFNDGNRHLVRVHGPTVFSSRWLIPRMHRFYQRYPHIEIWLSDFSRRCELTGDLCDMAISLEPGCWPDMDVSPLMPDFIFPVSDTRTASEISSGESSRMFKLLHSDDTIARWDNWPDRDFRNGAAQIHLSDLENVLRAAANGHGVALARGQLIVDELAAGTLARPLPGTVKFDAGYWLIKPKYGVIDPDVRTFASWIAEEARVATDRLIAVLRSHPAAADCASVPDALIPRGTRGVAASRRLRAMAAAVEG